MKFCSFQNMDRPGGMLCLVKQIKQSKTNAVYFHLYVEWNKNKQKDEYNKSDRLIDVENKLMAYQWVGGGGAK